MDVDIREYDNRYSPKGPAFSPAPIIEVRWDVALFEWRTVDGEEHLCPIRKEGAPIMSKEDGNMDLMSWKNRVKYLKELYEWVEIEGRGECLCPIKPKVKAEDIWSGRRFRMNSGAVHRISRVEHERVDHAFWVVHHELGEDMQNGYPVGSKEEMADRLNSPHWAFQEWL